jgi:cytoskeleton protein RodZ
MSEASAAQAAAMADAAASDLSPSAGTLLRQAREASGLHIGALSVSLKVPVKKLEALEADQYDLLPDAVFARALAASVCRTLKVDPGPILSRLPGQVMPRLQLESSTTDRASLHPPRALWRSPMLAALPRPVVVGAGFLLAAALVLYLLPSLGPLLPSFSQGESTPAADNAQVAPAAGATPATTLSSPTVSSEPTFAVPIATAGSAPKSVPGPDAAPAVSAEAVASGPGPTNASVSLVLFKATGASWVEVTDASGVLQLRKILNPGDAVPVSGALPLSVVVGRADAIEVLVRGQPFSLAPVAKDNVARFQVK